MTEQTPAENIGYTHVWSVVWRNPYNPRPEGFPQVVLRLCIPSRKGQGAGPCPPEIDACWEEMRHYGYCVQWHLEKPPARTLPLESKQRIRRRNHWKRLLKRYALFVEQFYAQDIQARPEYYGSYIPGEFADIAFMESTLGNLRVRKDKA